MGAGAFFLMFVVLVVAVILAVVLLGVGTGTEGANERRSRRLRRGRPTHAAVSDDGSSTSEPVDRPQPRG
jgi:hypothetical protein